MMSSYLTKPPNKGLFCGSRGCEGQRDDETLPQFCLWIQPPGVSPSLAHPYPHHLVHPHHTPFLSALFLAVPSGEEVSLSLYPCKHLGGPRKAALQGGSHRSLSSHPQSRYKVRSPVRPPHAASSNHPSRQLPAACVAFVTPPGLPCPLPCHITACV